MIDSTVVGAWIGWTSTVVWTIIGEVKKGDAIPDLIAQGHKMPIAGAEAVS